jgi:prolipoprotein diacylglyceryl transferase
VIASIPSPSDNVINVGVPLHVYGLLYAVAVIVAVYCTRRRWVAAGGDAELVDEVALWGFPAGLIGGRLYHVITSWNEVPHTWWGPFAVWKGGLGIWGGIALGVAVGLWRVKRNGANVAEFMDAGAPALLVAQSIGRVGNWFNQELFGKPTGLPWGLEIDPEHRPARYASDPTFHPTFLYEALWCFAAAGLLLLIERRFKGRIRPGNLFALYVLVYSIGRLWIETLRIDPSHELGGIRLNVFVAAAAIVLSAAFFVVWQKRWSRGASGPATKVETMAVPKGR